MGEVVWHIAHLDIGQGPRLVSKARTTNERRESLQTLANYMIIRCAAVGFNAEALCRGCIWDGDPPL